MLTSSKQVILATLFVQIFGFLKTVLIANFFGTSLALDGYYLALVVPSLVVGILAGMLQTGFVPVYIKRLADDEHKASHVRSQVFSLLLYVLVPFACVASFLAEPLVNLLVLGGNESLFEATLTAMKLLIFITVINALIDYVALIFNAHKRFMLASSAPLINILISSLFLAVFHDEGQLALTYGLFLGVSVQLVFVVAYLRYLKLPIRLMLIKIDTDLKKVISLSLAIFLGVCLANMNLVIDQVMASMVGEGAISQIGYANRFHNLIVQIVVMSVSGVLLTQLASLVVEKKDEEIKRLFQSLTNLIIFIGIFISISIYFFGKPFISILLERGALQQSDVVNISSLWFFYGLGLIPMMWGIAIAKFFQAISTPSLITKLALLSFVLNVLLNLIFTKYFGIVGLAMSTSLTYLLVALLYHANFVQKTQFSVSGRFEKVTALILTIFLYVCDNYIQIEPVSYQFCILVLIFVPITAMLLNVKSELSYIRDKYD